MKELIPVQQSEVSGKQVKTVNARDLHAFLESKQDFTTWIKDRIEKYGFAEGIDFAKFHNFVEKGYKPRDEYALTLDMAKELSMVERNARGKQARQYFIECERVALKQRSLQLPDFTNPAEAARAWAIQYEQKESALKRIEMDRPKVEFAETVSDIKDGIEIGDLAKVTYDRFGVGRNKLFSFLRDNRVLLDDNMPYQRYLDMGWFIVKEGTYWNKKYEKDCPCFKTLVSGKGQLGIFRMLSDKLGVPNAA